MNRIRLFVCVVAVNLFHRGDGFGSFHALFPVEFLAALIADHVAVYMARVICPSVLYVVPDIERHGQRCRPGNVVVMFLALLADVAFAVHLVGI